MKHASLFSGIGGAELAATWMGWTNEFHCEINPFGRKVLEYWFPNSQSYEDIKTTDFTKWRGKIDVLTGGFPCQPFSQAGKRKGNADNRYLWPQMLRAIQEIRPTWIVGENVNGITSMVESSEDIKMGSTDDIFEKNYIYRKEQKFTIERICKDFERAGYSIQPIVIPACSIGAPHRRDRVWFIAHRDNSRTESKQTREELSNKSETITNTECNRGRKVHNKIESKQSNGHGLNCNGNERTITDTYSDRWRIGKNEQKFIKGGERKTNNSTNGKYRIATNSKSDRTKRELFNKQKKKQFDGQNIRDIQTRWSNFPTQSPICSRNDGISNRLDGITFPKWRTESIKAYGNAWVPEVAYYIFKAIDKLK